MYFSFIIPVYNRPQEIDELLQSITKLIFTKDFEVVIVEDGSTQNCEEIIAKYASKLTISYYYKTNSGPGDSRNYGMSRAKGDYFIILDSDCILPVYYLNEVEKSLKEKYVDCFGGPDNAHSSFSNIQKAINFSMTSFLTTGGIRGGSEKLNKFQPRSFNMGISKLAFEESGGFNRIHPGEDPDLTIRLWKLGFKTKLIKKAYVFHKRRIDWNKFYIQVNKFGKVRPILNSWHPETSKITYWFPFLFCVFVLISIGSFIFSFPYLIYACFAYLFLLFILATFQNKSLIIGFYAIIATAIQFYGYGTGFVQSYIAISILKKDPEKAFPKLFFKKND